MHEPPVQPEPNLTIDQHSSLLPTYLATRDEPCPSCGYNLRALKTDRCPECNQQLVLRVGLAEPRMAAFITGLVGLAMGFGFSLILGVIYVIDRATSNFSSGIQWRDLWSMVVGSFVLAAALWFWLKWRGPLRRMNPLARWTLAIACYIASGAVATVIFAALAGR